MALRKKTSQGGMKQAGARTPKFRKVAVCKPCWELKYCPYGVMVETMPLLPAQDAPIPEGVLSETPKQTYNRATETLAKTDFSNDDEIWRNMFFVLFADTHKMNALKGYDPREVSCGVWGHVCPAYFYSNPNVTETREVRRRGRHIPREMILKVVRRDDYRCQECGNPVDDRNIEFDHVIPHSKGGPTSVGNIRLLCSECNRKKSNSLTEILHPDFIPDSRLPSVTKSNGAPSPKAADKHPIATLQKNSARYGPSRHAELGERLVLMGRKDPSAQMTRVTTAG